jgi:hypothetical protein
MTDGSHTQTNGGKSLLCHHRVCYDTWHWNAGAFLECGHQRYRRRAIGGTDVFGLFLEIGYDPFHLSRAKNVRLPGGRMLFPEVRHEVTPEEMLASRGLKPGPSKCSTRPPESPFRQVPVVNDLKSQDRLSHKV